jgi:hypothetical protein
MPESEPAENVPLLQLASDQPAGRRVVSARVLYKRTLAEYAVAFGLDPKSAERTLKRYVATGRAKEPMDVPPFDDPSKLGEWWRRSMKNKVPEWIQRLEQAGEEVKEAEAKPVGEMPPGFDLTGLAADAGDAEKELWAMANGFKGEMESARKYHNNARWWSAYTEYRKLLDELRKWEKDRISKRLQKGEVMETAVVVEALTRIFGSVSQTFTGCLLDLARQLRPELDATEARKLIYPLRDKVFAGLKESKFAAALAPLEEVA